MNADDLFFDGIETKVRQVFGVLDCCVFQNPKQAIRDLFVFVVIDPRRNKQQVIECIRSDSPGWTFEADGVRVIREVGGLPTAMDTKERRKICASLILELSKN